MINFKYGLNNSNFKGATKMESNFHLCFLTQSGMGYLMPFFFKTMTQSCC